MRTIHDGGDGGRQGGGEVGIGGDRRRGGVHGVAQRRGLRLHAQILLSCWVDEIVLMRHMQA